VIATKEMGMRWTEPNESDKAEEMSELSPVPNTELAGERTGEPNGDGGGANSSRE
jgi:hypothetical protein